VRPPQWPAALRAAIPRAPRAEAACAPTSARLGAWCPAMAIGRSGEWWVGSDLSDVSEFLAAFTQSEDAYPAREFKEVRCPCGSERYRLERAAEVTRRTCAACGSSRVILRTDEDWEEAEVEEGKEPYECAICTCKEANVVVGFAGYDEDPELDGVKWFYVGVRCAACGLLGCFNDGKVGRGPAAEVYESV